MYSSRRLILILLSLMFIPLLTVGGIVFTTGWISGAINVWQQIFSHWMGVLLIVAIMVCGVIVAVVVAQHTITQCMLLTEAAESLARGEQLHHVNIH